eukprot:9683802-Ditylum_brightwellii.AAC.1
MSALAEATMPREGTASTMLALGKESSPRSSFSKSSSCSSPSERAGEASGRAVLSRKESVATSASWMRRRCAV